jgi:hypothetical protein
LSIGFETSPRTILARSENIDRWCGTWINEAGPTGPRAHRRISAREALIAISGELFYASGGGSSDRRSEVFEAFRRWTYKRYEADISATDDFAQFERFSAGPWTPDMAGKMPWDVLIKGPQLGGIDAQTRKVIDMEIEKRFRSRQPIIANALSVLALAAAIGALFK